MGIELPERFREKTNAMPEYSQGANKVTLVLKDGRRIQHVFLAWGHEIVKIEGKMIERDDELPFKMEDVTDVISEIF
jgi:hypothetical protein